MAKSCVEIQSVKLALELMFGPADLKSATEILAQACQPAEIPGLSGDAQGMERIALAMVKLSDGSVTGLEKAVSLARTDYRDLLMAAGFGHSTSAHKHWRPRRNTRTT